MLDLTGAQGAQIDQRLRSDLVIWLSTVRPDGSPHLIPVWFLWDGATFMIFSKPDRKIRNVQRNNRVMMALESIDQGDKIVLIEGTTTLVAQDKIQEKIPAYREKYSERMARMQFRLDDMLKEYTETMLVTPTKFISW